MAYNTPSLLLHDFIAKCLTKDARLHPSAVEMLKHWSLKNVGKDQRSKADQRHTCAKPAA